MSAVYQDLHREDNQPIGGIAGERIQRDIANAKHEVRQEGKARSDRLLDLHLGLEQRLLNVEWVMCFTFCVALVALGAALKGRRQ